MKIRIFYGSYGVITVRNTASTRTVRIQDRIFRPGLAHGRSPERAVTIVCSIHQPQSKIFNLFDSLILLKEGNIMYQGPRSEAIVRLFIQKEYIHSCFHF